MGGRRPASDYYFGRIAVVTGAGSGIGAELARGLAACGARVWVTDIDGRRADQVAKTCPGAVRSAVLDVTDQGAFHNLVQTVVAQDGRVDLLFNHAGYGIFGELRHYTYDDWDRLLATNLRGLVHGFHAVYPVMIAQVGGHIVNTASAGAMMTMPLLGGYSATKYAVLGLSRALRVEAARHGVRVTTLCPGVVDTPFLTGGFPGQLNQAAVSPERQRAWWARRHPTTPSRIAQDTLKALPSNPRTVITPSSLRPMLAAFAMVPALDELVATRDHRAALAAFPEFTDASSTRKSAAD